MAATPDAGPGRVPAPREEGYTTTTPVPLYWARYGPAGADPLLVLHGGPGAHHDYLLPQLLDLARDRELVFYDQRGGGRSRTDARDTVTWETQVDDLARAADELVPAPITLLGYSWGGLLALLFLTRRVMPVSRLVLIAPASIRRTYREEFEAEFARRQAAPWIAAQRAELAASGLRERDPEAYRRRAFALSVAGYFAHPERARDLTPFRVTSRVQQSIWDSLGDFDLTPDLRAIRLPALIVHGREDPIPLASSRELAELTGARLVVLGDCGHVPYVERPAPLFAAIRDFLGQPAMSAAE
jgi:proline iminopeptidase